LIYSNEPGLFRQEILAAGQKATGGMGGIRLPCGVQRIEFT